jgi:hypothetical protein
MTIKSRLPKNLTDVCFLCCDTRLIISILFYLARNNHWGLHCYSYLLVSEGRSDHRQNGGGVEVCVGHIRFQTATMGTDRFVVHFDCLPVIGFELEPT